MNRRGQLWLLGALLGVAVFSAGLNLFLGGLLVRTYRDQLRAQIWPDTDAAWPAVSGLTNGYRRTILFLGDSRLAEWQFPAPAGARLVNAGVRRATTAQILPAVPGLLDEFHPDTVVIEAGINDLKYLGLEPTRAEELIAHTRTNLVRVVGQCRAHDCQVWLLEVWPPTEPGWPRRVVWSPAISSAVNRLNLDLEKLPAGLAGLHVVDLFARAGIRPGAETYRDTLHLRPETYLRLDPVLAAELASDPVSAP